VQIVIPMSGFGERFRAAGYAVPKPLIPVEGKPIIEHVVDLFPGERDLTFVCSEEHLATPHYRMREILRRRAPEARIVGITPHKLGPVHAVDQIVDVLDPERPLLVNYCDFTCYWNYEHFKAWLAESRCDGAVPAYRGFHPHSLGTTNYAYIRESNGWLADIREKQPFTANRMEEFASSGTYYFARAGLFRKYGRQAMDQQLGVGGEYYVSLLYRLMAADGLAIGVYPLQHFMQWGTPEDLREYEDFSRMFRDLLRNRVGDVPRHRGTTIVPMAGAGSRFAVEGYRVPKPLIEVSGRPMAVQAARDLPKAERHIFVLRQDLTDLDRIRLTLVEEWPSARCVVLPEVTDGQARTVLNGIALARDAVRMDASLTIGACDNGVLYDPGTLKALLEDPDVDIVVWGARAHAAAIRKPTMFSWIQADSGRVTSISMKRPVGEPASGMVVIGAFTFKRASDYQRAAERMIAAEDRTNGEFYVDASVNHAIALGLRCRVLLVDDYLCWGTPDELRSFEYWQSCFHKWAGHPYDLRHDSRIRAESIAALEKRFAATLPPALTRSS
jgi:NDP-sugar pyrophosphorylase family protein